MGLEDQSFEWGEAEKDLMGEVDTSVPVSARIWNYWMGGKDYYRVDADAGDQFVALYPGIRDMARASRLFIARAVTYLAGEAGVRQFLDIGTGLPSNENTHQVAQRVAAGSRVVYVDNDPLVLTHARALLTGARPEATGYIEADLNNPAGILEIARNMLDFTQPVAIMLMGVLGHVGDPGSNDDEHARSIVGQLTHALPPGGYLAIYEAANTSSAYNEAIRIYNETGAAPYHLRAPEQIARFFDGLQAVEPGIVPIQEWRPDAQSAQLPADIDAWAGVAVKRD
jgi:SAM-dependent methyltransferase